MRTATLPIKYKVENTGLSDGITTIDTICSSVMSEGGVEDVASAYFSVANEWLLKPVASQVRMPLISIRSRINHGKWRKKLWTYCPDRN